MRYLTGSCWFEWMPMQAGVRREGDIIFRLCLAERGDANGMILAFRQSGEVARDQGRTFQF